MSALTDWFAMSIKPEHDGVYQVRYKASQFFALWKGKKWFCVASTPDAAARQVRRSWSCYSGDITAWRGRAQS